MDPTTAFTPVRERIVEAALRAVERVRERRHRDIARLRNAHLESRVAVHGLTIEQVRQSLAEFRAHVGAVARLAREFEGQEYRTWNDQRVPADESHYGQWLTRQVIDICARQEERMLRELMLLGDSEAIAHALFEMAAADAFHEDSIADGPEGIAGYEAKIILFYALPEYARRTLVRDLELRFDLRDVAPAEFVSARRRDEPYDYSVLTDGYFYGSLRTNAKSLLDPDRGHPTLGRGIDCSSLVQETYEHAGFDPSNFKSPVSTASMIAGEMPGLKNGTFEVERLMSSSTLVPGDAILRPGHVQVFVGRDEQGNLRIAEAVGRRFKTVRESVFAPRHDPTLGDGLWVFENAQWQPVYVFRPRSR